VRWNRICGNEVERPLLEANGIEDIDRFCVELEQLYTTHVRYHPQRWFALAPNVPGKYHPTDELGFRNSSHDPGRGVKIGFFGGSTMYSVRTPAEGAIPAQVERVIAERGGPPIEAI